MSKIFVKDIKEKDQIDSTFLVKNKSTPIGKSGKPYLVIGLGDRTGTLDARVWDNAEAMAQGFDVEDFVRVRGTVNLYQKRLQLIVHGIEKVSKKDVNSADYLPSSQYDAEVMYKTLLAIAKGMKNKYLRQLVLDTLEDPEIRPKYLRCPAARSIHHAWIGGLLEHTLSICQVMLFMASHYKHLDLDLLIVGAVFHDIGKIWEFNFESNVSYTDAGKLIGHLVMGVELVEKRASKIPGFPEDMKIICKHLVVSHHGKVEYGSPKLPSTPEALVVAMIDELDSKISALQTFMENERTKGEPWSGYSSVFDRYFFLGPKNETPVS